MLKFLKSNKDSNKRPYSKMFKRKDSKMSLMLKFLKAIRTQTKVFIQKCLKVRTQKSP